MKKVGVGKSKKEWLLLGAFLEARAEGRRGKKWDFHVGRILPKGPFDTRTEPDGSDPASSEHSGWVPLIDPPKQGDDGWFSEYWESGSMAVRAESDKGEGTA